LLLVIKKYSDILRRLWDAIRRKRPEKWRTSSWFLQHDNAPAHRSVLVKNFLARNNVTTLDHPPFSPAVSTAGFYLLHRLKSSFKRRRFCDATDIIQNASEKAITKWLPGMFSTPVQLLAELYSCTNGLFLRKYSLNVCILSFFFYLSVINCFREHFEVTTHFSRLQIQPGQLNCQHTQCMAIGQLVRRASP